jgi:aldose 1-epimerase
MAAHSTHEVMRESSGGFEGVVLVSRGADLRAAFCPQAGMVGYSLKHGNDELLGQRGGLQAYVERGSTFGIPLLHPWANRLSGFEYEVAGRKVELDPNVSPLHPDEHGLPIHGLLASSRYWELVESVANDERAWLRARFDFAAHDELLTAFPFEHELTLEASLAGDTLTIVTTVVPTDEPPVPISFGWHPYLTLPGENRRDWHVELPVRRRAVLDDGGIPTGGVEDVEPVAGPLGEQVFDDLFTELGQPGRFVLAGAGRRVVLEQDLETYPVAQVYAPEDSDFICWEPMTAPTNALVSHAGLGLVEPGKRYSGSFSITVSPGFAA